MSLTVTRRRVFATLISLAMIAAVLATASDSEAAHPNVADVGTLDLILDDVTDVDQIKFLALAGSGLSDLTDDIGTQGACNLKENGPDDPATFTAGPAGAVVGKKKTGHEIGVRFNEGNGEPCARIDDSGALGQTLTLKLDGSLAGYKMDEGNVALRLKFGATAKVELFDSSSATPNTPVASLPAVCSGGDCGADSGGDRVNVAIPAASEYHFNSVKISIMSPSDGAAALIDDPGFDTWFNVIETFDGILPCEGQASETGTFTGGIFSRLDTDEGAVEVGCATDKLYNLAVDQDADQDGKMDEVHFVPKNEPGVKAIYRFDLSLDGVALNPLNNDLEYDKDGFLLGVDFVLMPWCDVIDMPAAPFSGVWKSDPDGAGPIAIGDLYFPELAGLGPSGGDGWPEIPSTHPTDTACITSFSTLPNGIEVWSGLFDGEDPFMK